MGIAQQTMTQTDLRIYAATRDHVLKTVRDHVFSHDPLTAIMLGRDLGSFGGVKMRGAGKSTQVGGASVKIRARLGKHTGFQWMAGPFAQHSVSPDDNLRLLQANWIHASGALVLSDYDRGVNRGEEAMIDFVASSPLLTPRS